MTNEDEAAEGWLRGSATATWWTLSYPPSFKPAFEDTCATPYLKMLPQIWNLQYKCYNLNYISFLYNFFSLYYFLPRTFKERNQLNLVYHTFPPLDIIMGGFCLYASPYFNLLFVISIIPHLETHFPWLLIPLELTAVSQVLTSSLLFTGMFLGRQSRKQKTSISFP